MIDSSRRLTELVDQIGRVVSLKGVGSGKGKNWFNYRGIDVYVELKDASSSAGRYSFQSKVTGVLERKNSSNKPGESYFMVKEASWITINQMRTPEISDLQISRFPAEYTLLEE